MLCQVFALKTIVEMITSEDLMYFGECHMDLDMHLIGNLWILYGRAIVRFRISQLPLRKLVRPAPKHSVHCTEFFGTGLVSFRNRSCEINFSRLYRIKVVNLTLFWHTSVPICQGEYNYPTIGVSFFHIIPIFQPGIIRHATNMVKKCR